MYFLLCQSSSCLNFELVFFGLPWCMYIALCSAMCIQITPCSLPESLIPDFVILTLSHYRFPNIDSSQPHTISHSICIAPFLPTLSVSYQFSRTGIKRSWAKTISAKFFSENSSDDCCGPWGKFRKNRNLIQILRRHNNDMPMVTFTTLLFKTWSKK
jgi:hypothetical protein